jgi:cysteine-S-conjugate beta-lyase
MTKPIKDRSALKPATRIVTAAREYAEKGFVNPALYRGSTILLPSVEALANNPYAYGRRGSTTVSALNAAVTELEAGHDARIMPSGLSAVSTTLLAFLSSGDHLLITDAVYYPTRHFCDTFLTRLGIEVTYFNPLLGAAIDTLIRPNSKLIYCESPGSQTMEVMDIPAIVGVARKKGCRVLVDNSWSGGHFCKPLQLGADISLQSGSKYIGGHSDILMGTVCCTEDAMPPLAEGYGTMGMFTGPDDIVLALRGMRTLEVRLARHMESALHVARWLQSRPEVARVMHPGLASDPGHEIWKRDFTGSSGLFSIELNPCTPEAVSAFVDDLKLFGIGFGWGGFESLCIPFKVKRTASTWAAKGPGLRFHIGLEHPEDLMQDLEDGFARLNKAR